MLANLLRELRQLSDVVIVDDDSADWRIEVLSFETEITIRERNRERIEEVVSGFALSVVTLHLFPDRTILRGENDLSVLVSHRLIVSPLKNLKQACENFVALFDTKILEPIRREISEATQ